MIDVATEELEASVGTHVLSTYTWLPIETFIDTVIYKGLYTCIYFLALSVETD